MDNGFHLIRAVFFALLLLFNLLTLGFSAWNINLLSKTDLGSSATASFVLFESCLLLVCIAMGFLESFIPTARTSNILVECAWTVTLSLFQLGAAISATMNGPPLLCRSPSNDQLCTASSLLVPSIWLSCVISFAYFFTFFITVLAHRIAVANIWAETVYSVSWFDIGPAHPRIQIQKGDSFWERESIRSHIHGASFSDIESAKGIFETVEVTAPWAKDVPLKRGVDAPFSLSSTRNTPATSPAFTSKTLPPIPSFRLSTPRGTFSPSRFVERFRESRVLSRAETPTQFGRHLVRDNAPFPSAVVDHDQPIPKPRGCEWVRADALKSPV
ncbi:hypothetical protein CC1G_04321 [Coprinopsis cinerea okayama7|uniref:MARVEL domain-containing protein n=1 Tax=Coprinopsis cinerea (strain Okayama-7 / 130 / ATCC MYA-4618 / FGSC 9003) TaxID=240176 RepID=A8NFP9_COPC7|nr:hypothetical protein CC1G_04321 [Coprinopsis cinerea okayama7\|eukprot:XP_001833342.2 hypothetical protein CC1G_04321 [Coprinopsis cinerea okayama7\